MTEEHLPWARYWLGAVRDEPDEALVRFVRRHLAEGRIDPAALGTSEAELAALERLGVLRTCEERLWTLRSKGAYDRQKILRGAKELIDKTPEDPEGESDLDDADTEAEETRAVENDLLRAGFEALSIALPHPYERRPPKELEAYLAAVELVKLRWDVFRALKRLGPDGDSDDDGFAPKIVPPLSASDVETRFAKTWNALKPFADQFGVDDQEGRRMNQLLADARRSAVLDRAGQAFAHRLADVRRAPDAMRADRLLRDLRAANLQPEDIGSGPGELEAYRRFRPTAA